MSAGENHEPGETDRPGETERHGEKGPLGEAQQPEGIGRLLVGRYRVLAQLGRGGMGVVWRALDEVLGREVAVKELRTYTDAGAPELADLGLRMQREARAAARVRHPGVVAVHDVAEIDGRPLIVMELVDGPSLDDVLRERGTLDAREAADIGAKVVDALAAAHRAGVLHRDVKPGNILLDRSGRVVLTDFGIATMEDPGDGSTAHLTRSGELVGSLDYLAPERAQGHEPGPASDIWALGATLYAAVEGVSPFRRTSTWSTLTAIVVEPLPEPRRAGPLGPVLRQLMDKRPEARPDAGQAGELLEAVAGGTTDRDSATRGLRPQAPPAPPARDTTERNVPAPPPGFGPPPQQQGADAPAFGPADPGADHPESGSPHAGASGTPGFGATGFGAAPYPGASATPASGSAPYAGASGTPAAPVSAGPSGSPGSGGFGPPEPMPHAAGPATPASATPAIPAAPANSRRGKGRVLLAAVAVTVVLAATGVTLALLKNSDGSGTAAGSPEASRSAGDTASPGASRGSVDLTDGASPTEQGDKKKSSSPSEKPDRAEDAEPTDKAPAPSPEGTDGGTTGGSSGGGTAGGGDEASPAPVCHAIGGGKYNCQVWKTATSYTAAGAQAGTLNTGTNYFYCQQNLGRRETSGQWTNTWWAKTDDDSGNTGVYVSDVYIKGGDNDSPLPGLPVC
ncbi:hypothetical protein GCM10017557_74880 [Streptomyces aurantiacus]|uniref:non-specific serine/threonine protein kinase n=1 Tax=Streptomyces aurantiacus TaxID=47760 RepID=A0A7G1PB48_9ACTN|nr:hypothetical protein GCM10017557_74880 [Streptomyces aurantiacus]